MGNQCLCLTESGLNDHDYLKHNHSNRDYMEVSGSHSLEQGRSDSVQCQKKRVGANNNSVLFLA